MLLAQISDCHITAAGGRVADRVDPAIGLRRGIEAINVFDGIDLVVGTGDLVNDGHPHEYDELTSILGELTAPFLALPGNHDDRTELRTRFGDLPAGGPADPIDHVVDVAGCRLVCLDTTIPGEHGGRLTAAQLGWLDAVLAERSDVPVVVAQHHPPVPSGIPSMDDHYGLAGAEAEAAVLAGHDHVATVIAGHYHRAFHRRFGRTVVACCPSTAVQLALRFDTATTWYCDEPTGWMLHRIDTAGRPSTAASHLVPVGVADAWVPSWAVEH